MLGFSSFIPLFTVDNIFFMLTDLIIYFFIASTIQTLHLIWHKETMFIAGLIRMLMIVKVQLMEKDGHHSPNLLLPICKIRSPCTEHLHILSS